MKTRKIVMYILVGLAIAATTLALTGIVEAGWCWGGALIFISLANIWNGFFAIRDQKQGLGLSLLAAGLIVIMIAYYIFIKPLITG